MTFSENTFFLRERTCAKKETLFLKKKALPKKAYAIFASQKHTFLYSGADNNMKEKVKEALRDAKNNRGCV